MKRLISLYKTPLLLSLTLAIVLVAVRVESNVLQATLILIGAIFGTFLLDFEYFIFSFVLEPAHHFSQSFTTFVKHKDYVNAILYAHHNETSIKDKTLNSILFQLALAALCLFAAYSSIHIFVKAFLISGFANSIYKLIEKYYNHTTDDWFWALKNKPTKKQAMMYILVLTAVLIVCVTLI